MKAVTSTSLKFHRRLPHCYGMPVVVYLVTGRQKDGESIGNRRDIAVCRVVCLKNRRTRILFLLIYTGIHRRNYLRKENLSSPLRLRPRCGKIHRLGVATVHHFGANDSSC